MTGIVLLLAYAGIMLAATLLFTRRPESTENFHVADRKMGAIASAMSIAATWIWAPALFTSAEKAYTNGFVGLFWFLVPNVLCLLFFVPFAKKIRKRMPKGITLAGFMKNEYASDKVKKVYMFQLAALSALSTAVQLLAGGKILSTITGLDFTLVTVVLAVIAFSYAQFSGIRASVLTDAIQMIFLLAACAIFVPWALKMNGGLSHMLTGLSGLTGEYTSLWSASGVSVMIAYGLPTAIGLISGPFGDQCFWQRAFSIDEKKIGKAFALGALMFAVVPASMGILGFIAAGSGYVAADSGIVNLELVTNLFPAWVTIPFLFMLISGLLSTVDSNCCAIASLTTDIAGMDKLKDSERKGISIGAMIVLLVLGICIANIPGLTVTKLFLIYGTLRATTLLPTVLTLCNIKLTGNGIVAGIVTALATGLPVFTYATLNGLAVMKTAASIYTVLISGAIALLMRKKRC